MTLKEIFNEIKNRLNVASNFAQVDAFCGDTRTKILEACANEGVCVCVSFEDAEVSSANASYRIKPQTRSVVVYYVCSIGRMVYGEHLDDIEKIFSILHSLRIGNDTLQPKGFKLIDRDSVLVYALNFTI